MRTAYPGFVFACSLGALLVTASPPVRAQGALSRLDPLPLGSGAELEEPAPAAPGDRFDGRAIYLGAGPGLIADLHEPSFAAAVYLTLPVSSWMMFEGAGSLTHLAATGHHGEREETNGLGIGAGLRFAPLELGSVRPYLAARVAHVHFSPDPWGEHSDPGGGTDNHDSMHRWGAGLGAGLDMPLSSAFERWRLGVDLGALALSGPEANVLLHAVVTLGLGI